MYRKFKKVVLGLILAHATPSVFYSRILRNEALVYNHHMFLRTAVFRKLFDFRFSYKHCNSSRVCLLVKMASKTVTRSNYVSLLSNVLRRDNGAHLHHHFASDYSKVKKITLAISSFLYSEILT